MLSYEEYVKQNYPDYYELLFAKKKTVLDVLAERFDDSYLCPYCHRKFALKTDNRCFGHGEYCRVAWLTCDCGLQTKEFCIYDASTVDSFLNFIKKFKC